jgi:WhiB family redox-sensing transcriptional regulator
LSNTFQRLAAKTDNLPCREDPELFYDAESAVGEPNEHTFRAKAMCRSCPIVNECLYEAMANDERFGIWGSMTTSERARFQNQLGSIAA